MSPKPKARRSRLPLVQVNVAMTADGKIATANRVVSSFGSTRDHEHLLQLRATADAVMAGARTLGSAPINLGPGPARFRRLRLRRGLAEYNLRIVVSGSGMVNPQAQTFQHHFSPIIVLTTERASKAKRHQLQTVADAVKVCGKRKVNFQAALRWLRERWGVKRLLCEGGGELNGALFRAGLVDELHLTVCPTIFGGRDAPTLADGCGFRRLDAVAQFQIKSLKRIGREIFAMFCRAGNRGK